MHVCACLYMLIGLCVSRSEAFLSLSDAGLTNPPGQPHFYEIPRPDSKRRPAYIIWWHPPSYPSQLDTDVTYSLSTLPEPTLTRSNSTEVFIPAYSYYYLVVNEESELSERSPSVLHRFDDSQCRKQGKVYIASCGCSFAYLTHHIHSHVHAKTHTHTHNTHSLTHLLTHTVYFPPRLFANCDEGRTNISWTNNPNNSAYYSIIPLYSINGPVPGQYYINVTCSLPDNTVFAVRDVRAIKVFSRGICTVL